MSTIKETLVAQLEADIVSLQKDADEKLTGLKEAVEKLKALTDEEVLIEVGSVTDNVRFLAQFTAQKTARDEAHKMMAEKGGEIPVEKE